MMGGYNISKDLTATRQKLGEVIDEDRRRALSALDELGCTKKISNMNLYHGRVKSNGKEWEVSRGFNNAGNNSGNHNINKIPALNVAEKTVAEGFARARKKGPGDVEEVHEIISRDPEARIYNMRFSSNRLEDKEREDLENILEKIALPLEMGKVYDFNKRSSLDKEEGKILNNAKYCVSHGNTLKAMFSAFMDGKDFFEARYSDGQKVKVNFSLQYFKRWLEKNHIVGVRQLVDSATLGKTINIIQIFNLDNIETKKQEQKRAQKIGNLAKRLYESGNSAEEREKWRKNENFFNILYDPKASPEQLMQEAKKISGFKEIFEKKSGVWEGYTVEEHTEAVLRNFENNYADSVPVGLLPIMKLCLLVHDIGKGVAAEYNGVQKEFNKRYAESFMRTIGIPQNRRKLIEWMITEGTSLTSKVVSAVRARNEEEVKICKQQTCDAVKQQVSDLGFLTNRMVFNPKSINDDETGQVLKMCLILQTCDSMAYSSYAEIRDSKTGLRYQAYGSFDASFEDLNGFLGNQARIKW